MIKTIILASFFAAFALIAMPVSSAQAHCGTCETKSHTKKPCEKTMGKKAPCEKCVKAGKPCKCGDAKKPCDKKLDKKPCEKKMGKKPCCGKCAKTKKPCTKSLKTTTQPSSYIDHSSKGSLTFKSGTSIPTRGTGSYN